jgi:hypothetical protein
MPLRVRRGTNADRQTITPDQGELIYTIDTKRLYIGDGINAGGLPVTGDPFLGIDNIVEDTSPELGGNLSLNSFTVNGTGSINIQGGINATSLSLQSGEGTGLGSNLIPTSNNAYILGNANKRFKNLYTTNINIDGEFNAVSVNADIVGDDSTILIDSATSRITTSALAQASATDGQVLKWNNGTSTWTASDQSLSLLSDVDATNPQNNQVLTWNSTASKWQALAAQGGGGGGIALTDLSAGVGLQYDNTTGEFILSASVNDLTDVTITSATAGQTLVWNPGSSSWINDVVPTPAFGNITDIDLSLGVIDDDFLQYDSGSSSWKAKTLDLNDTSNVDLTTPPTEGQILIAGSDLVFRPASPIDLEAITTNIVPSVTGTKNVGTSASKWNELWSNSMNVTSIFTQNVTATGNINGNVIGNVTGDIAGDLKGSVFADDSTLLIDGTDGSIKGPINNTTNNTLGSLTVDNNLIVDGQITSILTGSAGSVLALGRDAATDIIAETAQLGAISFKRNDPVNGNDEVARITANIEAVQIFQSNTQSYGVAANWVTFKGGNFGIGSFNPTSTLDVQGDIKSTGTITPGVYADASARDAAITSPTAGMMVFVTDVTKFQGYDGSAWVNLN